MVVSSVRRKLTYEDYLLLPEDGRRHEILNGVHVVSATPVPLHQDAVLELSWWIYSFLRRRDRGKLFVAPMGVILAKHDFVVPDLFFLSREKLDLIGAKNIEGVPDLVIEVLSPSTRRIDLGLKRARYERLGVGEYWVLDPAERTAEILRRLHPEDSSFQPPIQLSAEADDHLATPFLPGLEIPLRQIFSVS